MQTASGHPLFSLFGILGSEQINLKNPCSYLLLLQVCCCVAVPQPSLWVLETKDFLLSGLSVHFVVSDKVSVSVTVKPCQLN